MTNRKAGSPAYAGLNRACFALVLMAGVQCVPLGVMAQIRTDGTLGAAAQTVSGPRYLIPESLGRLFGTNLFQSFGVFNINTGESATFTTTTAGLTNVISRVTGGSPSQINGSLSLQAASGAPNFFFINPAGVMFGAGAVINVPGAFHVSTADYIRFPDGKFYADPRTTSTLSSAPPEAFGFLGASRASVTVSNGAALSTRPLQPISLIAGDIEINNAHVTTQSGDIRIVALGQRTQEVGLSGALPTAEGNLNIGNGGLISSSTIGANDGGNLRVSAGRIDIGTSASLLFTGIVAHAAEGSTGNTGTVDVTAAGNLSVQNGALIRSITFGRGSAGAVSVTAAGSLTVASGGLINSTTQSSGNSGTITVNAGSIVIDRQGSDAFPGITSQALDGSTGAAGSVSVTTAGHLSVVGGLISASTANQSDAGSVRVNAGSLSIDGLGQTRFDTGIFSQALRAPGSSGNAGTVDVTVAGNLSVLNRGQISSSTFARGNSGAVNVTAGDVLVNGTGSIISARAEAGSSGQTGNVSVTGTSSITLSAGGTLSIGNAARVPSPAGIVPTLLAISAPRIVLSDGGRITAASTGNVAASNIAVTAGSLLSLTDSAITTSARDGDGGSITVGSEGTVLLRRSQITTSVTGLSGNGGDIVVNARALVMDTGFIQANTAAAGASGGKVTINANSLITSANSLYVGGQLPFAFKPAVFGFNVIQAAAPGGVSGTVRLNTPALDVSGGLSGLNAKLIDAGGLGRSRCQATGGSSLAQTGRGGMPPSARDLLRVEPAAAERGTADALKSTPADQPYPLMSSLACAGDEAE